MLSVARYEGEASMAATARDIAKTDEERVLNDQAWAAYSTAARHARLAQRWSQQAAADRQMAAQPPKPNLSRVQLAAAQPNQAQLAARADSSAAIAARHVVAAEQQAEAGQAARDQAQNGGTPGAPGQGLPPAVVDVPYVAGTGTVGETLTCTMGNWTGEPTSYAYQWKRDGTTDLGTDDSYVIAAADAGSSITCVVTATNALGSTTAPPSNAVAVANGTRRAR
jgi:hypothetical protein